MKPNDARLRWKTRLFTIIVILSNALGNFALDLRHARPHHGRRLLDISGGDFHARG